MKHKKLYSNCSEWTGKLNNRTYEDTYNVYIDKDGKEQKELEDVDVDISISTDSFPNGGLNTAIDCLKEGFDINDIEWDNVGGGANGEMLDKDFAFARKIIVSKIDFDDEDIDRLDALMWGDGENVSIKELTQIFSKIGKDDADSFALKLMKMDNVFGKTLLKLTMLKEYTKTEITKILVAERLEGKDED